MAAPSVTKDEATKKNNFNKDTQERRRDQKQLASEGTARSKMDSARPSRGVGVQRRLTAQGLAASEHATRLSTGRGDPKAFMAAALGAQLTVAQQQQAAKSLKQQKLAEQASQARKIAKEASRITREAATGSKLKAGFKAARLAVQLRHETSNVAFIFMLSLAILKDGIIDFGFLGTLFWIDWIIDIPMWIVWMMLAIFLFGKGKWKIRIALFLAGLFENLDTITGGLAAIISTLPLWTISVIYAWWQSRKI
jgi:hypothetical protein